MWKCIFNSTSLIGCGFNRDANDGEVISSFEPFECAWFNETPGRYKLVNGSIVERPEWTQEEQARISAIALLSSKQAKQTAIESFYAVADAQPVLLAGRYWRGGEASSYAIKGQIDLYSKIAEIMPELNITTVKLYDATGTEVALPLQSSASLDAWDVAIAVATAASAVIFAKAGKLKLLSMAQTIEQVNLISLP